MKQPVVGPQAENCGNARRASDRARGRCTRARGIRRTWAGVQSDARACPIRESFSFNKLPSKAQSAGHHRAVRVASVTYNAARVRSSPGVGSDSRPGRPGAAGTRQPLSGPATGDRTTGPGHGHGRGAFRARPGAERLRRVCIRDDSPAAASSRPEDCEPGTSEVRQPALCRVS
jgi:hypothetical protein